MAFRTLTIGRHKDADVRIDTSGRQAVSRLHAEVTIAGDDRYYLIDRNSSYGTHVMGQDGWVEHRHGYLPAAAPLRLGECETSLANLLRGQLQGKRREEVQYEPLSIRPRRNPGTGEVEG